MKFIEIREGVSVRMEDIISVSRVEEDPEGMMSFVSIKGIGQQGSTFPYLTLLEILEHQSESKESEELDMLKSMEASIRNNAQRFDG